LSSPEPIVISGSDRSTYSCFSVNSFTYGGQTVYSCSSVFKATPYTQPATLTGSDISAASATTADIAVASYTSLAGVTQDVTDYQAQCLNSTATVCDPAITSGPGALAPATPSTTPGTFTVSDLVDETTYQCFSVISYQKDGLKYTCSEPYQYNFTKPPTFTGPKGIAITGTTAFVANSPIDSVYQCTISGKALQNCAATGGTFDSPQDIAINGTTVYTTTSGGTDAVKGCLISGTSLTGCQSSLTGLVNPTGIAVDETNAYIVSSSNKLYSCTAFGLSLSCDSGGGSLLNNPSGIAINENTAYITNLGDGKVISCNITGGAVGACADEVLFSSSSASGIAIYNGTTAFIVNVNDNRISSCTLKTDGPGFSSCLTAAQGIFDSPYGIAIDGTTAFITNQAGGTVTACNINGGSLDQCVKAA